MRRKAFLRSKNRKVLVFTTRGESCGYSAFASVSNAPALL